jgi:PAS domain S-box-containing protein
MQDKSEILLLKERLEAATQAANIGIWDWDPESDRLFWNATMEAIYGLTSGSVRSYDDFGRCVHPDDIKTFEAAWDASVSDHQPFALKFRIIRPDGVIRWIESKGRAFYDADGKVTRIIGTNQDITERENIEQDLKVSEARYRAVVEDQTEIIIRILPDGTLTFANEVYCRTFGQPAEALVGTRWHPVAHHDDLPMIESKLREMSADNPVVVITNRVFVANDELRWMQFVNRGFFDPDGRLKEIQVVGRDVTDLKRVEAALQETGERLKLALAGSGLALWDWHIAAHELTGDERMHELLGLSPDTRCLSDSDWLQLIDPRDRSRFDRALAAHLQGDMPDFHNQHRLRHQQGHWVAVETSGRVTQRDAQGTPLRMIGTIMDISQRRRLHDEGVEMLKRIEELIRETSVSQASQAFADDALDSLTKRERQILGLIADGMTSVQIGRQLELSPNTVITHRQKLMKKLDLHSTAEVIRFALDRKLSKPA